MISLRRQDRNIFQLQESVNSIADTLKTFVDNFNTWKQSVEGRLPSSKTHDFMSMAMDQPSPERPYSARASTGEQHTSTMPTPTLQQSQLSRVNSMKQESPVAPHSHGSPMTAHTSTSIKQETTAANPQPPATPRSRRPPFSPFDSPQRSLGTTHGGRSQDTRKGLFGRPVADRMGLDHRAVPGDSVASRGVKSHPVHCSAYGR